MALVTAASAGCAGGGDAPTDPAPTSVLTTLTVSVSPANIQVGQTATATALGRDQFGAPIATGTVTWSSATTQVATVSGSGSVQGVSAGQSTITATAGGLSASATIVVSAGDPLAVCRLPAHFPDIGLGFPRVAHRLKVIGDVRITAVFVDFPDAVATRTPQSVFAILSPTSENYFRAVSYGGMNLILEPSLVWQRMSRPTTAYGWNALTFNLHRAYIQEALDLASTVDFSRSDAVLIVSNPDVGALNNGPAFVAGPGFGVTAGGRMFLNAVTSGRDLVGWGGYWLNHELGHTMGLPDLYAYSGAGHRFVGAFSLMGLISGHSREFFGWERWLLGWVDDAQVTCAGIGTNEFVLTPVERTGGTKLVVVPTGATSAIVVESRRAEGYDTSGNLLPGALVYLIDTSIGSGGGVLRVLPINDADASKATATLRPGGSVSFAGVTVTSLSQDAGGDRVRVVR
jgi:M6 family metalloprotease-like protein